MLHALAILGTGLLGLLTAAVFALLLIAIVTPTNPGVDGDVAGRRAAIIMFAALAAALSIFFGLALTNL